MSPTEYFQRDSKVFKEFQKGKSGARYREIMGRLAYLSCKPRRKILQNIIKGYLPFTKTIRLEISGINIKHFNATLRERESQKILSTSARET